MSVYKKSAAVVGAALVLAVAIPAFVGAADKLQEVIVRNTADQPIPVTSPLWQGTPYVTSEVVLGANCESLPALPAGQTFFVERAIVDFNVKQGMTGSAGLYFTPLGGSQVLIDIPVHVSSRAQQVAGIYDGYAAEVEIGLPTNDSGQGCFFAGAEDDIAGSFQLIGYLVPAG